MARTRNRPPCIYHRLWKKSRPANPSLPPRRSSICSNRSLVPSLLLEKRSCCWRQMRRFSRTSSSWLVHPPLPIRLLAQFFFSRDLQGVVHLTSHRFTFHASLISSQPGQSQNVVRSGSALVHRKGWRRKSRVWLQLDHDMISSFPSSRDEDKIKPLRSILCMFLSIMLPFC